MHLIEAIVAGIRGAENGHVTLCKRGTSTRATWYDDFEGQSANASGTSIDLDANGSAVVYVNELVDVVAYDDEGTVVRAFTAGAASGNVEYQGQSFTGTSYETAAQAAGNPNQLQAILDLWKTNAGSIDWKVLVGSTATKLSTFASAVGGMFFNVKDSTYGAVGDGVADDTAAIAAALSAANVPGGIVFFPPGTYRTTSQLTFGGKVSLLGCSPNASAILIDHASNNCISVSGSTYRRSIVGLRIGAQQANSGHALTLSSGSLLDVEGCVIGGANNTGDVITATGTTSTDFTFRHCSFGIGGSNGIFNGAGALQRGRFIGCIFDTPAGAYSPSNGQVFGRQIDLIDCLFLNSATSGTYSCFKTNSTSVDAKVIGCMFASSGGATVTAMELGTYASGAVFFESGNNFGSSGVTAYSYTYAAAAKGAAVTLLTRESRKLEATDNTASITTLAIDQYGIVVIKRTTNANQVWSGAVPPEGSLVRVAVWNASGGSITAEGPQINLLPSGAVTIADGRVYTWNFLSVTGANAVAHALGVGQDGGPT